MPSTGVALDTDIIDVLLIEDNEDDAVIARSLISEIPGSDFHVTWEKSYEDGLQSILQNQHHVCLLDYNLGSRTGLDFLGEALQYGCRMPIIMMTGTLDQEVDFKAIKLGAADYVIKGEVAPALLERVIRHGRERKKAEVEREELHAQLLETSRQLGMADIAINVLHNVGNVLNSINVSVGVISQSLRQTQVREVERVANLLSKHSDHIGSYLQEDPKGKLIPPYLNELGKNLSSRVDHVLLEVGSLVAKVEHVKQIVDAQQEIAKPGGLKEPVRLEELLEQALMISRGELAQHHIEIIQEYASLPQVVLDKHQVLQILVNIIRNAKHAMIAKGSGAHRLTLRIQLCPEQNGFLQIQVSDTGVGIKSEHLTRIFSQGFTTKKKGHGIGLHSSALAAKNCGGSLHASSDGEGCGATFTLVLPATIKEVPE